MKSEEAELEMAALQKKYEDLIGEIVQKEQTRLSMALAEELSAFSQKNDVGILIRKNQTKPAVVPLTDLPPEETQAIIKAAAERFVSVEFAFKSDEIGEKIYEENKHVLNE